MSTADVTNQTAAQQLAAVAARHRVCERELERAIYKAAVHGVTQRQISELVGNQSQATIQRILRRIADDEGLLKPKPAEIIDQRTAGIITSEEMMATLLKWTYTFGRVVHVGDVATDAYMSGDWDAIEMAFYRGQLTDDEFQQLADRQLHADLP